MQGVRERLALADQAFAFVFKLRVDIVHADYVQPLSEDASNRWRGGFRAR
jgi:hypothetical protein